MALDISNQIKQLIKDKKNILITFDKNQKGDAIASASALLLFLKKLDKRVDVISSDFSAPKTLQFIKGINEIKSKPEYLRQFVINIDTKESGIHELSYDFKDKQLRIFVTPKNGFYKTEQLTTGKTDFKYDLIITLGTPDFISLGDLYINNTELFFEIPIINIDNNASNEHYGHINLIDLTATTTSELIYNLINNLDEYLVDEDIATSILTGIISNTHSFKNENISPKTLETASKLINIGADRDFIIKQLYRTRSVATLRLWGQALSAIEFNDDVGLVCTVITKNDVIKSGATTNDIPEIIEELLSNSPEAKMTLLLFEDGEQEIYTVKGIFVTDKQYNAKNILSKYNPIGSEHQVIFSVTNKSITDIKSDIIDLIKNN